MPRLLEVAFPCFEILFLFLGEHASEAKNLPFPLYGTVIYDTIGSLSWEKLLKPLSGLNLKSNFIPMASFIFHSNQGELFGGK